MRIVFFIFFITALTSCGGEKIQIENFNNEIWKNDPLGCKGEREALADILIEREEELLGNSSHKILEYLGKPDKTELYNRNQKFYHYYISPGVECGDKYKDLEHDRLTLRFSATDLLKEVSLYN